MDKLNKTNEYYTIEKKENNFYYLNLKNPNKELLLSLNKTGLLLGSTITDNFQSIQFRATNLQKLNTTVKLNYSNLLNLFYCLTNQIHYLIEKEKKCFYTFNPENIMIIDNKQYIYLSPELYSLNVDQNLTLFKPFLKSKYNSPELNNATTLPLTIHYKSIYFSLAIMLLELIDTNTIKNTKLYFALKRCLKKIPEERVILFI